MGHRLVNSANCKPKDQGEAIEHYLQNPLRCQNVSEFDRMKSAVYPGSFDPFTNGHLDIVNRALKVVDEITIAVLNNSSKKNLFTPGERVELIQQVFARHERVKVDQFSGLLVDYCRSNGKTIVVRGLRTVNDFQYEHAISLVNHRITENESHKKLRESISTMVCAVCFLKLECCIDGIFFCPLGNMATWLYLYGPCVILFLRV